MVIIRYMYICYIYTAICGILGADHIRQRAQRAVDVLRLPSPLADGLKICGFPAFRGLSRPFSASFWPLWVQVET